MRASAPSAERSMTSASANVRFLPPRPNDKGRYARSTVLPPASSPSHIVNYSVEEYCDAWFDGKVVALCGRLSSTPCLYL